METTPIRGEAMPDFHRPSLAGQDRTVTVVCFGEGCCRLVSGGTGHGLSFASDRCQAPNQCAAMHPIRPSMLIEQHLGEGKFVVTNSCRQDIPLGTRFNFMSAERGELQNGAFIIRESKTPEEISVRIAAIEFWRKPWHCVPNGHHAGVMFDGDGVAMLTAYLARHSLPWHVSVEAVQLNALRRS